jgi:hypothetical protein
LPARITGVFWQQFRFLTACDRHYSGDLYRLFNSLAVGLEAVSIRPAATERRRAGGQSDQPRQ